ncbi:MAG: hypothetical protein G01um10148_985 [Parcubacteria group bacterium Gr01-1014_8]|nr:MAG: hypothetical protein G01um10148_985 [Parcubacteria group bacterium Gr01-1014_8]
MRTIVSVLISIIVFSPFVVSANWIDPVRDDQLLYEDCKTYLPTVGSLLGGAAGAAFAAGTGGLGSVAALSFGVAGTAAGVVFCDAFHKKSDSSTIGDAGIRILSNPTYYIRALDTDQSINPGYLLPYTGFKMLLGAADVFTREIPPTKPKVEESPVEVVVVVEEKTSDAIPVSQQIQEESAPPEQATKKNGDLHGKWSAAWRAYDGQSGTSEMEIQHHADSAQFSGTGTQLFKGVTTAFTIEGTVQSSHVTVTMEFPTIPDTVIYEGALNRNYGSGKWTNTLQNSGTWSMTRDSR